MGNKLLVHSSVFGGADTHQDTTSTSWTTETFTFTTGATDTSATVYATKPTIGGYAFVNDIMVRATVPTPKPALRISDATVGEGDSGTTAAHSTVTLSPASSSTVAVAYADRRGPGPGLHQPVARLGAAHPESTGNRQQERQLDRLLERRGPGGHLLMTTTAQAQGR